MRNMPGQPSTGRGRASRERIVAHAAELFAQRGVTATSLDDVLTAAGAGKGQFYHYFRSRDELVAAAVGLRCTQVLAQLGEALGSVESMPELASALAGFVRQFEQMGLPGCPIGTLATEVVDSNEGARLHAAAAFDAWEKLFADALMRIQERGELRPDASPDHLATALLASLEGGMMLSMTRKDPASMRIAMDAGLDQVQRFRT
jgi:AcrR family transcriptional regulator